MAKTVFAYAIKLSEKAALRESFKESLQALEYYNASHFVLSEVLRWHYGGLEMKPNLSNKSDDLWDKPDPRISKHGIVAFTFTEQMEEHVIDKATVKKVRAL